MSITRTPTIDVDLEFTVDVPVTKAYVDSSTGERRIRGVATGIAEDRDGERVSKNAIVGMGRQIEQGGIKVTSSHQQDWMTEIGKIVRYEYDADTDEMIVDGVLPPEGVDPIADKAWRVANQEKLGWSIGGKLRKSYFERNEVGKKRKVLDAIHLRHCMLTKNPAYEHSFAEAVAKTFEVVPSDDQFTLEGPADDLVTKDVTGSWASGSSDSGGGNTGRDSVGSGKRNAGTRKPGEKGMRTDDDGTDDDGEDQKDLPQAKGGERHLACPNCGHEFAADLPVDDNAQQPDDESDNESEDDDRDDTGKSTTTGDVDLMTQLAETLDVLKKIAEGESVEKTDPAPTPDVEKTDEGDPSDVMKSIAAVYQDTTNQFETLRGEIGEAFTLIAKSHKAMVDLIKDLPQGRKSVARVIPPAERHGAPGESVEKSFDEQIAEAPTAVEALKASNHKNWGVDPNR